jgi:hypothetical protein
MVWGKVLSPKPYKKGKKKGAEVEMLDNTRCKCYP